ncbi:22974_t:CDS:2, partial [Gigaspora rosea]
MSSSSNYSPEDCSEEENLQIQLDNDIYISDLEEDSIEAEQEEIIQSINDLSFEEIIATNEENLAKNLKCTQQVKLSNKEADVWKFVDKQTLAVQAEKTQAILKWIILSLKPFKVVEEKAFHNMVQKLDPLYQIPTQDSVKKLRKLIKTIRKSTKILEDLEQLAVLNEKTFLVPILDCKTRWNSTYQMIKRACLLYESINMLLIKHPSLNPYMPDIKDWQIYEDLVVLLELFNDATIELSSQTYPTIAHAQIILLALRNDLENKNFLLEEVVEAMLSKFIEYFNTITESLHISAFLDPRYKKLCFPDMTIEEILTPIRQKINQQPSLLVSKKVSSFYQKLKNTSQQAQIMDDEAHKYWLFAEADETIKLLD